MPETVKVKKKKEWYAQVGVSQDTFAELEKIKAVKERELGIALSWNSFFTMHVKEWKEAAKAGRS